MVRRTSVLGRDRLQYRVESVCSLGVHCSLAGCGSTGARPSVAQSSLPSTPTRSSQVSEGTEKGFFHQTSLMGGVGGGAPVSNGIFVVPVKNV